MSSIEQLFFNKYAHCITAVNKYKSNSTYDDIIECAYNTMVGSADDKLYYINIYTIYEESSVKFVYRMLNDSTIASTDVYINEADGVVDVISFSTWQELDENICMMMFSSDYKTEFKKLVNTDNGKIKFGTFVASLYYGQITLKDLSVGFSRYISFDELLRLMAANQPPVNHSQPIV